MTTRERRARCTARAEAFDATIFGPIFRVKAHFSGAILGVGLLREQGNLVGTDSIQIRDASSSSEVV